MHRLILEKQITWTEAETIMSMQEVLEFNEVFDAWHVATQSPEPSC